MDTLLCVKTCTSIYAKYNGIHISSMQKQLNAHEKKLTNVVLAQNDDNVKTFVIQWSRY